MTHWSARQMLVLLLAVFAFVGMSLSAVQSSDMMVKMAVSSNMGASGAGDCDGCNGTPDDDATAMTCSPACVAPAVALLPQTYAVALVPGSRPSLQPHAHLLGQASSPDPYPPRPDNLG